MSIKAMLQALQAFDYVLEIIHMEFPKLFEINNVSEIYKIACESINPEIIKQIPEDKIRPIFTLAYDAFSGHYPRQSYKRPD